MNAAPINKGREHIAVARRPGAPPVLSFPTTVEQAKLEAGQLQRDWPDARVAVYRLVYEDAAQPAGGRSG